ncbi:MAG: histidine--tRNA ligase [Myxococcota bacterium]
MTSILKPSPISGFPEWLPEQKLVEEQMLQTMRSIFESYGFTPIETAAVERKAIVAAKGVADKELYALERLGAAPGEDASTELALHFDLTVPTARYVAQNYGKLVFPFRRYQIQKVWRGERPQAGRFREFYQCDIDVVGHETLDLLVDAEMLAVVDQVFRSLNVGRTLFRISNRKILHGLLSHGGLAGEAMTSAMLAIDALEKLGMDRVREALTQAGLRAATTVLELISSPISISELVSLDRGPFFALGVKELELVSEGLKQFGVDEDRYAIDLTIARGLDYYTGTVYETRLTSEPELGSICSGGRYENLASAYSKQVLPGVGLSIGLTRLLSRLFEKGELDTRKKTPAEVLVTMMDVEQRHFYIHVANKLREAGIPTELYTEPKKLKAQLKYADAKGFDTVILAGSREIESNSVTVKSLRERTQEEIPLAELALRLKSR